MNKYNPIRSVDGQEVPCPSSYKLDRSDISQAKSGRTESGKMYKLKIGQYVKLELSWKYISTETLSILENIFDPEYMTIEYFDTKLGQYRTSEFYAGDRTSPMYNGELGLWESYSVNVIERTPH